MSRPRAGSLSLDTANPAEVLAATLLSELTPAVVEGTEETRPVSVIESGKLVIDTTQIKSEPELVEEDVSPRKFAGLQALCQLKESTAMEIELKEPVQTIAASASALLAADSQRLTLSQLAEEFLADEHRRRSRGESWGECPWDEVQPSGTDAEAGGIGSRLRRTRFRSHSESGAGLYSSDEWETGPLPGAGARSRASSNVGLGRSTRSGSGSGSGSGVSVGLPRHTAPGPGGRAGGGIASSGTGIGMGVGMGMGMGMGIAMGRAPYRQRADTFACDGRDGLGLGLGLGLGAGSFHGGSGAAALSSVLSGLNGAVDAALAARAQSQAAFSHGNGDRGDKSGSWGTGGGALPGYVGIYDREARRRRIERFLQKKKRRVWSKVVKYDVRKSFADSRVRVKGRFVRKDVPATPPTTATGTAATAAAPAAAHAAVSSVIDGGGGAKVKG